MQEVLLRVFRRPSGLRDDERFGAWLAAMVRNAVADQLRARQRHPLLRATPRSDARPRRTPDEPDETARASWWPCFGPFAARLPAIYREVIILSELEDVPHAEIARRLAISVSGVKSRVQRGREQLREDADRLLRDLARRPAAVVECVPKTGGDGGDCCSPNEAPVRIRAWTP